MSNLPNDISPEIFGKQLLATLNTHGFGVLGKADLEAALLHALLQASPSFKVADSYQRAEMLRITDQKYRTISRRTGMWLDDASFKSTDTALFGDFLKEALKLYAQTPDEKEVRLVIDDEIKRRNMQRALEREALKGSHIAVEISMTGRSLVLRGSDLDRMIERVYSEPSIDAGLKQAIKDKQSLERRRAALEFLKKSSAKVFDGVVAALLQQAVGS